MSGYGHLAPNNTKIITAADLRQRASGAATAAPLAGFGGTQPSGLGYLFSESWKRTQLDVVDFQMPQGRIPILNEARTMALENVFVAKAVKLRTIFMAKNLRDATSDDNADSFFTNLRLKLKIDLVFRKALWDYNVCGLACVVMPDPGQPLDFLQILDPRMVRTSTVFGQTIIQLFVDKTIVTASEDPAGKRDPMNAVIWSALPTSWKRQLTVSPQDRKFFGGKQYIMLDPTTTIIIENRFTEYNNKIDSDTVCPLSPFMRAAAQYRQLMAGDFATAFMMKNFIMLVTQGGQQGGEWSEPGQDIFASLQAALSTPDRAQVLFGSPTFDVKYFTPDPAIFKSDKYDACKEELRNLLPTPFWAQAEGSTASFAASTLEMQVFSEEVSMAQEDFAKFFWLPIYNRAIERTRIPAKLARPPKADRSSLVDRFQWLQAVGKLYADGGLSFRSMMKEYGYDYDTMMSEKQAEMPNVKKGLHLPSTEASQGLVSQVVYGIDPHGQALEKNAKENLGGRPQNPGKTPSPEQSGKRTPRPSDGSGK